MMIIKRNQIIIFVLALLLITVGYLSIGKQAANIIQVSADNAENTDNINEIEDENLGDATLVDGPAIILNEENLESETKQEIGAKGNTEELVISKKVNDEYFSNSKLERENMYSQMLTNYQKIIKNTEMSSEQKSIAQNEIIKINNEKNAIMITENLIKTKGFGNVVIFINNTSINVILEADTLSQDAVAQVQNIVSRELNAEINNIHIITK